MNHTIRTTSFIIIALILTGCSAKLPIKEITDHTKRYELIGARVGPPAGTGWYTLDDNTLPPNSVAFYKEPAGQKLSENSKRGHTYVASFLIADASDMNFSNAAELGSYADEQFRKDHINNNRYRLIKSEWSGDNTFDSTCIRWHKVQEDFNHPVLKNQIFIKDGVSIVCMHPVSTEYMVMITWGESRPEHEASWDYTSEVKALIDSIEFIPVKK